MNLLNQVFIYAQHAPDPEQASFESPLKFASIINQLNKGGRDLITKNIINNDNNALNLFVLIFLLTNSKNFIPEWSNLTKFNPIKPIIKGKKKLIVSGKKIAVLFSNFAFSISLISFPKKIKSELFLNNPFHSEILVKNSS